MSTATKVVMRVIDMSEPYIVNDKRFIDIIVDDTTAIQNFDKWSFVFSGVQSADGYITDSKFAVDVEEVVGNMLKVQLWDLDDMFEVKPGTALVAIAKEADFDTYFMHLYESLCTLDDGFDGIKHLTTL